ncbi:alpha-L-arabinofuranosidase C-terminal domain-containing protein [Parafilimonas terrae]|uniref:non-reducing end alpha-L-arabinofuranosidase n=1 Tax=Parafilimonas terrae TaxID=1465490 RepID=A0A1I5WGM6_9BACT|nr:alpha-L-arabinofuranosidase C-terminal domain-containing protein [Parafilimonas terrae]SFQ18932.1 Alpha-L-arabinofuranosidase [Parafilimonas terrae]
MKISRVIAIAAILLYACTTEGQPLVVKADKPTAAIQPTMWGIFFEDINLAADGGLYAELVKNRSFEFASPLMGWTIQQASPGTGNILVTNRLETDSANPRYIRVTRNTAKGKFGLTNEGFRGMGIKQNEQYNFTVWAKSETGNIELHVQLVDSTGRALGESQPINISGNNWQQYKTSFTATATELKARMNVWFEGEGVADIDMLSLFPQHTWKQRPNGLRADLVQLLADMKPGFLRFPGGCIVEGRELATRYQWKKTVGPVEDRQVIVNRWNTEFAHRPTPDYFQSFGLGFFEYFQVAEDIGATPLPILNCGMACQFNSAEVVDTTQLDPYIQDALDLIEFANGDVSTKWGHLREVMGHPDPFNLKLLGIGNEQWGPQYVERYKIFTKAIKYKYPEIQLVNSVGPSPDDERFHYLNDTLRKLNADILDEHYYSSPSWFQNNANRYDDYDRNGPKIFAGEYAAQSVATVSPLNKNNWLCALSEAAFMTGLERNADIVQMASYAPLFAHVEGWQWTPDLIWFDNLNSFGTPNYYVQKLFANNKGDNVVAITSDNKTLKGSDSLYASAVTSTANEVILKIVNTSSRSISKQISIDTKRKLAAKATVTTLQSNDLNTVNSIESPKDISPLVSEAEIKSRQLNLVLHPYSFTVIHIKMQ